MEMSAAEYLRGMAYHEAGHAVVAWALGIEVGDIHVRQVGQGNGGAQIAYTDEMSFIDRLAVCFAGSEAETVCDVPQPEGMNGDDHRRVYNLLHGISARHGRTLRDQGRGRARDLLTEHKANVTRLAERLFEAHQVSTDEFLRLMGA